MANEKDGIQIVLTPKKSEEFFHSALCNGMSELSYSGLELDYKAIDYKNAVKSLEAKKEKGEFPKDDTICREDVWMEILRMGKKLKVIDHECDGEYTKSITLKNVHERVQDTPFRWLSQMIEENDDATTAFEIMQQVFFEESVFG